MNGNAGRGWKSKATLPTPRARLMYASRKLEEVHRELDLLAAQGKTAGFLSSAESAQRINGLVEDIREVMMDYQVHALTC